MGKKASLSEVLAEGKERLEAAKASKASKSSSSASPPVRDVPMNAKLPGGITLKGYMKQHGIDYQEAAAIYKAYTADVAADELKIARYGLPSAPVDTPARAKTTAVAKKSRPAPEEQIVEAEATNKSSVTSKKAKRKAEDSEPLHDEPKPVKRVLFAGDVAEHEALPAPRTRVSSKRPGTGATNEGAEEATAIAVASPGANYRRKNATDDMEAPSTPGPSILKRKLYLNFISKDYFLDATSTN